MTRVVLFVASLLAGLFAPSYWFEQQWHSAQISLRDFDLSRALVVQAELPAGRAINITGQLTGSVTQFLIDESSLGALRALSGVAGVDEFRERSHDVEDGDGLLRSLRLMLVEPGFLALHHMGDAAADQALAQQCLVADADLAQSMSWRADREVTLLPDAATREALVRIRERAGPGAVLDDGRITLPVCPQALRLPTGLSTFERTVFLSVKHPSLLGRTSFPRPLLWVSLKPGVPALQSGREVQNFISSQARPAQPDLQLSAMWLADYGRGGDGLQWLQTWRTRLRWSVLACSALLVASWLLVRWGPLRRELALRRALGQTVWQASGRIVQPIALRLLMASLLSAGATAALLATGMVGVIWTSWAQSWMQLGLAVLGSLTVLAVIIRALAGQPPMPVLSKEAR